MSELTFHERYMRDLIACQGMLYAHILTLVADRDLADEILQETNLTLIRRETDYRSTTDFHDWACAQAFYQVLTDRKRQQRDKLIFDDDLLQALSENIRGHIPRQNQRRSALRDCLALLDESQRQLLEQRYSGQGVGEIAAAVGRTEAVISQTLYRLRKTLKECIRRKLASGQV